VCSNIFASVRCLSLPILHEKQLVAQQVCCHWSCPCLFYTQGILQAHRRLLSIPQLCSHWKRSIFAHRSGTDQISCGMQTQGGRALAVPLFVVLAQNRALHIVGQDKGVGQVDPTLRAEDRIRVVSDRFDQANRLLVQASLCTSCIAGCNCQLLYSIMSSIALPCKTVITSSAHLASGLKCITSGLKCMRTSSKSG